MVLAVPLPWRNGRQPSTLRFRLAIRELPRIAGCISPDAPEFWRAVCVLARVFRHARFRQSVRAFSRNDRQCFRPARSPKATWKAAWIRTYVSKILPEHIAPGVLRAAARSRSGANEIGAFRLRQQVAAISEFGSPSEPRFPRQSAGVNLFSHNAVGANCGPAFRVALRSVFCWAATRWAIGAAEAVADYLNTRAE